MSILSLAERAAVVGTIDPQTVANTELFTDVVDMSKFLAVAGVALLGNMASETITFKAYTCDSDGSNSVALKTSSLTASASANDNTQLVVGVRAEELLTSGKRYCRFGLVTGGATGGAASVVVLADSPRIGPATLHDLASVTVLL
jgi:hypothetical protein